MLRAVLDTNVLVSALISPRGTPAQLLRAWGFGSFELIVSPTLLDELQRVLACPKLRRRVRKSEADTFVAWLKRAALVVVDPAGDPPIVPTDPADSYLLSLAASQSAVLVTGDHPLLALGDKVPIRSPAAFLAGLDES